jgi:hypothetical protein
MELNSLQSGTARNHILKYSNNLNLHSTVGMSRDEVNDNCTTYCYYELLVYMCYLVGLLLGAGVAQ